LDGFVTKRREEHSARDLEDPDEAGLGELTRDLARVTLGPLLLSTFFEVELDCFAMLSDILTGVLRENSEGRMFSVPMIGK
jgi:hypothetical protein